MQRRIPISYQFLVSMGSVLYPSSKNEIPVRFDPEKVTRALKNIPAEELPRDDCLLLPKEKSEEFAEEGDTFRILSPEMLKLISEFSPAQLKEHKRDIAFLAVAEFKRKLKIVEQAFPEDEASKKPAFLDLDDKRDYDALQKVVLPLLPQAFAWFEEKKKKLRERGVEIDAQLITQQAEAKENKLDQALNLSYEESRVLSACAASDSHGEWFQGGVTLGLMNIYLYQGWLRGYLLIPSKTFDERNIIERLKDKTIKVSSLEGAKYIHTINAKVDKEFFLKSHLDQHLEEKGGTFTLVPDQFKVMVDEKFWQEKLIPIARKILNFNLAKGVPLSQGEESSKSEFTNHSFFALIPFLCDDVFRTEFCERLAAASESEQQQAFQWIEMCYQDQPELQKIKDAFTSAQDILHRADVEIPEMKERDTTVQVIRKLKRRPTDFRGSPAQRRDPVKIPLNYKFLTGMYTACHPDTVEGKWNPDPYTLDMVEEVNRTEIAKDDLGRTDWNLGGKEKSDNLDSSTVERPGTFLNRGDLRIYSWLKPERQVSQDQRQKVTISELLQDEQVLRRLIRKVEYFQYRLSAAELIQKKPIEVERLDEILNSSHKPDENELRPLVNNLISWLEKANESLGKAQNAELDLLPPELKTHEFDQDVNLSSEECSALYAFSVSIGKAVTLQGGCLRGIQDNCFSNGWLNEGQQLSAQNPDCVYEEAHRLMRLEDGSLGVTSSLEITDVYDSKVRRYIVGKEGTQDGVLPATVVSKALPVIKFSIEQIFRRKVDAEGRVTFTMLPSEPVIIMDRQLWETTALQRAYQQLEDIDQGEWEESEERVRYRSGRDLFRPRDFFALIPYLSNEKFRSEFCKVAAKQPAFVISFAKKWIRVCYKDSKRLSNEICLELDREKRDYHPTANERPPRIIKGYLQALDYKGYLYDSPACAESFLAVFQNEANRIQSRSEKFFGEFKESIIDNKKSWGEKHTDLLALLTSPSRLARFGNAFKNFISKPPVAVSITLGVILGITGAALAATGVLAPLGVALGLGGAAMTAPGAVAAMGAICLTAPGLLYGLGSGLVQAGRALGREIKKVARKRRRESTTTDINSALEMNPLPLPPHATAESTVTQAPQTESKEHPKEEKTELVQAEIKGADQAEKNTPGPTFRK